MRIGELARQVGLRTSAIRYYEELGLLEPARRVSGRREYGSDALNTLRLVRAAQQAGFSLDEIRTLLSTISSKQPRSDTWVDLARTKLEHLEESIERLRAAHAALTDALDCACAGAADACKLVARTESGARTRPRRPR
jgi:MerR family redox-sensitive transcriptional activator SoxR